MPNVRPATCVSFEHDRSVWIGRIPEHGHASELGKNLLQQFESLAAEVWHHQAHFHASPQRIHGATHRPVRARPPVRRAGFCPRRLRLHPPVSDVSIDHFLERDDLGSHTVLPSRSPFFTLGRGNSRHGTCDPRRGVPSRLRSIFASWGCRVASPYGPDCRTLRRVQREKANDLVASCCCNALRKTCYGCDGCAQASPIGLGIQASCLVPLEKLLKQRLLFTIAHRRVKPGFARRLRRLRLFRFRRVCSRLAVPDTLGLLRYDRSR
jgi:hypothetical protein